MSIFLFGFVGFKCGLAMQPLLSAQMEVCTCLWKWLTKFCRTTLCWTWCEFTLQNKEPFSLLGRRFQVWMNILAVFVSSCWILLTVRKSFRNVNQFIHCLVMNRWFLKNCNIKGWYTSINKYISFQIKSYS